MIISLVNLNRVPKTKPPGYEEDLGNYGICLFDGWSGEAIGWGFKIIRRMSTEKFNLLSRFGDLECVYPTWFLITDWLTPGEAIKEYGPIGQLVLGPMKGFRSVSFGDKTFSSKKLDPRKHGIEIEDERLVILKKGE